MKKYIFLIAIILFATSCENEIPFNINENPPKLVVNALFDANKEENSIMLTLTGREHTTYTDKASIDIYVNGIKKEQISAPDSNPNQYEYKTKVRFAPDDVVRIEARTNDGKYYAWAEDVVPKPIAIEKTDTTIFSMSSWWYNSDKFLRVRTTFTDDGQQTNYYRIVMEIDCKVEAQNTETLQDTIFYKTLTESLYVNEDVVLTDGRPSTEDDENGLLTPVQNLYGVFDNSRINGTYTMIASLRIPYSSLEYIIYDNGYGGVYNKYAHIKKIGMKVRVKLKSISKMQYLYLKALNTYDSIDYDDYFNLPVKFPSNIEGGTGIFGISISTENETVIPLEDYVPNKLTNNLSE